LGLPETKRKIELSSRQTTPHGLDIGVGTEHENIRHVLPKRAAPVATSAFDTANELPAAEQLVQVCDELRTEDALCVIRAGQIGVNQSGKHRTAIWPVFDIAFGNEQFVGLAPHR
jgi:hypothetical protein